MSTSTSRPPPAALRAAFGEVDITPPLGTAKMGWIVPTVGNRLLDPLAARLAILATGRRRVALIALDTLSVRWSTVDEIRRRIEAATGFPGRAVMVAASHNHAGPAICNLGQARRDEAYTATLVDKIVACFVATFARLEPAEIAFGSALEWRIGFNRRLRWRDGTTHTHGTFDDPMALCFEGPDDPEVGIIALRAAATQAPLGCVVNFACHPVHHGGSDELSAGYPGALAAEMRQRGWPVTVFLTGACGNVSPGDPRHSGRGPDKDEIGRLLAEDVAGVLPKLSFAPELAIECRTRTLELPLREVTEEQLRGTVFGAQRFAAGEVYDGMMPALVTKLREKGKQKAELQVFLLGDHALAAVPGEYFVEFGLQIKEETWPRRTLVVSCANGMVGYLPTRLAFRRGGYETTLYNGTYLAPGAGEKVTAALIRLVNGDVGRRPA